MAEPKTELCGEYSIIMNYVSSAKTMIQLISTVSTKLKWTGRIMRMDGHQIPKKIFLSHIDGESPKLKMQWQEEFIY